VQAASGVMFVRYTAKRVCLCCSGTGPCRVCACVQGLDVERGALRLLAERTGRDVRSVLNSLQVGPREGKAWWWSWCKGL
jgi:hypothetical protein